MDSVPANILVNALMQTQGFEKEMKGKFDAEEAKLQETGGYGSVEKAQRDWLSTLSKDGGLSGLPSAGAAPAAPDMSDCIISDVFVPYLAAYVGWERTQMEDKFRDHVAALSLDSGSLDAFLSAAQLLQQVKNSVSRCGQRLGLTGPPLYQLSTAVKACIRQYADMLLARLPQPFSGGYGGCCGCSPCAQVAACRAQRQSVSLSCPLLCAQAVRHGDLQN